MEATTPRSAGPRSRIPRRHERDARLVPRERANAQRIPGADSPPDRANADDRDFARGRLPRRLSGSTASLVYWRDATRLPCRGDRSLLRVDRARRTVAQEKPPPAKPTTKTESAAVECPNLLGNGVKSGQRYCDIVTGTDAKNGAIVRVPPHRGVATLRFDLHNRQMFSAELERSGRAYTRALATVIAAGASMARCCSGTPCSASSGTEADLIEWIAGGAGPNGVKAVAPVGTEKVVVEVPESYDAVALVGETLSIPRAWMEARR